jgi:hypothetical protein
MEDQAMAKVVLSTNKGNKGDKKFKLEKGLKNGEKDVDLDINSGSAEDVFIVEKLDMQGLDNTIIINGKTETIVWFNNFQIKKESTGEPINQNYKVKIAGLKNLKSAGKNIVIQDGNVNNGRAYIFTGIVSDDDSIELSDGDPAIGNSPP